MFNDENPIGSLIGTLFLGGMFYLSHLSGKEAAKKEIEDQKMRDEIANFKKRFDELGKKGF